MVLDKRFAPLLEFFPADEGASGPFPAWTAEDTQRLVGFEPELYTEFISGVARSSYAGGLLRVLLPDTKPGLSAWNGEAGWASDWQQWAGRLVVFAFDWLGRQFAFDRSRVQGGEPLVSMLEPGTGELLEIPETFSGFIEREIIDYQDAALAASFHRQWLDSGGAAPRFNQCVGYKIPLFLGGTDEVSNLALTDLEVHVSFCGQLYAKNHLPPTH